MDEARPTSTPTNKVVAATGASAFGGYVGTLLLYLLGLIGFDPPAEVKTAITGIVTALLAGTFGYLVPPGAAETVVATAKGIVTARRTG